MARERDVSISIGLDDAGIEADAEAAARKVRDAVGGGGAKAVVLDADTSKAEAKVAAAAGRMRRAAAEAVKPPAGDSLIPSLDRLIGGIGAKSGREGQELKSRLEGFREAVRRARDEGEGLSEETSRGLAAAFEKWLDVMNRISPGALKRISDDVRKVLADYQDFSDAVREGAGVEVTVDTKGLDALDALKAKLEIIDEADALTESVAALSASLKTIDPGKAEELRGTLARIREEMGGGFGAESVGRIAGLVDDLKRSAAPLGSDDLRKLAPGLDALDANFSRLRQSVDVFGSTLREEFDASRFAASLLSGDVEGVTRGFVGLAAGAAVSAKAIRAAFATTVVGALVAAVAWLVNAVSSLVAKMMEARRVATELRCERLVVDLDHALAASERLRRSLEVQRSISDDIASSIDGQVEATARLEAATLKLAKARAMAAASTRQEREEAESRFDAVGRDAASRARRERDVNELKNAGAKTEAARRSEETRRGDVEKAREAEAALAGEVGRLKSKVEARGGYVDYDAETGKYAFYSKEQILSQIAFNDNGGFYEDGVTATKLKGRDTGVPQAAIDSLKKNLDLRRDPNNGAWYAASYHWHDDADYEEQISGGKDGRDGLFAKLRDAAAKRIKAEDDARLAASEVARLAAEEAAKRKALLAQIEEEAAERLAVVSEVRGAREEMRAADTLSARANRRTREDALAYDSDRARLLDARIAEEEAFSDANLHGGVDARGERVKGIEAYEADIEAYGRAVEARRLSERMEAGDETLTAEERGVAEDYNREVARNRDHFAELSAAMHEAARQLPRLHQAYRAHEDAIAELDAQMARLAKEHRDRAVEMELAESERAWGVGERRRSAAYARKADFAQDAEDRSRAEEGKALMARYDAEAAADAAKHAMMAAVLSKGEADLTEAERMFKAAHERHMGVTDDVVNDLAVRRERGETTEEENRRLDEIMEGRVNTAVQNQILARNRGVAEQMALDSGEAARSRAQERLVANEAREHRYALEDEEYERGRKLRRANSASFRFAVAEERNAAAGARFADADALAKALESGSAKGLGEAQRRVYEESTRRRDGEGEDGYIARMKLFEAKVYRARDEARERVVATRDEMDGLKVERENREASFLFDARREGNRLTQLGLGGGDAVRWQQAQASDIHELLGVSRQSLRVMRNFAGRPFHGVGRAAWR